jgi:hypothetical protein
VKAEQGHRGGQAGHGETAPTVARREMKPEPAEAYGQGAEEQPKARHDLQQAGRQAEQCRPVVL